MMAFVIGIQMLQLYMFHNSTSIKNLQASLIRGQDGRTQIIFEQKPLIDTKTEPVSPHASSSDIENQVRLVEQEADAYDELRRSAQKRTNHQSAPVHLSQREKAKLSDQAIINRFSKQLNTSQKSGGGGGLKLYQANFSSSIKS